MVTIQYSSLALATLFKYPNPFSRSFVKEWAVSEGFDPVSDEKGLAFDPGGMGVAQQNKVAEKDRFVVMFNPEANLHNFGDCAYVTIADGEDGDASEIKKYSQSFDQRLKDNDLYEQQALYEVTFVGTVRVGDENDLNNLVSTSTESKLGQMHGESSKARAIRLSSGGNLEDESHYFKLLFDTEKTGNPTRWQCQYVRRYKSINDFDKATLNETLRNCIELTEERE